MSDTAFQAQTLSVLREIRLAFEEIKEALGFPGCEHLGYRLCTVDDEVRKLEQVFVYGKAT